MEVTRYNAKETSVLIDGVHITQVGEDYVSGSKEEDFFETSVGAQGDIVKSEINNTIGEITLTVQVTSPQKSFLLGLANRTDEFPIWVTNKSLGERMGGTKANLLNYPELARGASAEDIELTFKVFDFTIEAAE